MKRILTILPILSLVMAGCLREPFADAFITPNPAYVGEDITFTNISENTDYVEWEMGDGSTSSSFDVIHYYNDPDFYDVNLVAFGVKGGVHSSSFIVEVIGSELKIIVQLWTPVDEPDGYFLEGASVILYPTLDDWVFQTNPVAELFTNTAGECIFDGLSYQRYYVDVWEANHDNYLLAEEDVAWIETQELPGAYDHTFIDHTFIAYVDYYENGKKSTSRSSSKEKVLQEGFQGEKRDLKINKITEPRKGR